jgi:hypothetical protein
MLAPLQPFCANLPGGVFVHIGLCLAANLALVMASHQLIE